MSKNEKEEVEEEEEGTWKEMVEKGRCDRNRKP